GAHYRWPGWLSRMQRAQLIRSMSRKGCSPDNSACEGFFGRLKNEMFYNRTWINTTADDFMQQLHSYIQWYNQHRIKLSLGGFSPAEYRQNLGTAA
ncbi:Integrase core domain-containing protein, partial [Rhizobium sp. NFR07]|uniref:IS3 family transposase n=1 Tax=Rhizobium sp. NFR07 TaxID=1566262 RepID=UPI0008EEF6FC